MLFKKWFLLNNEIKLMPRMIIFLIIQIDVSRFYLPNRSPITLECWKWKILLLNSIKQKYFLLMNWVQVQKMVDYFLMNRWSRQFFVEKGYIFLPVCSCWILANAFWPFPLVLCFCVSLSPSLFRCSSRDCHKNFVCALCSLLSSRRGPQNSVPIPVPFPNCSSLTDESFSRPTPSPILLCLGLVKSKKQS